MDKNYNFKRTKKCIKPEQRRLSFVEPVASTETVDDLERLMRANCEPHTMSSSDSISGFARTTVILEMAGGGSTSNSDNEAIDEQSSSSCSSSTDRSLYLQAQDEQSTAELLRRIQELREQGMRVRLADKPLNTDAAASTTSTTTRRTMPPLPNNVGKNLSQLCRYYQREWRRFQPPGEAAHMKERWQVRKKLLKLK